MPKIIINDTINLFFKLQSAFCQFRTVSFRVLFDKISSVYLKKYIYIFGIGNGQLREPALCQLYRHTFVPYFSLAKKLLYAGGGCVPLAPLWCLSDHSSARTWFSRTSACDCAQPNKRLKKKLPRNCEVANILVGEVCKYSTVIGSRLFILAVNYAVKLKPRGSISCRYCSSCCCYCSCSMRNRVYETAWCPSVRPSICPSVASVGCRASLRRVCCCGPGAHKISIDC